MNLDVRTIDDGYYFINTSQVKTPYFVLTDIIRILERNYEYTTRIFDDFAKVRIPSNQWKGRELQVLLEIANYKGSDEVVHLHIKIQELVYEKLRDQTQTPAILVQARELGYIGDNKFEAREFVECFRVNIHEILKMKLLPDLINVDTVAYDGEIINLPETLKRVKTVRQADRNYESDVSKLLLLDYIDNWWIVHLEILTGMCASVDFVTNVIERLIHWEVEKAAVNYIRYHQEPTVTTSLLHFAMTRNAVSFARKLVEYGADPNVRFGFSGHERTVLEDAFFFGCRTLAETLISHGARINEGNPLLHAFKSNVPEGLILYLIEKGARVNLSETDPRTSPLTLAASQNCNTLVEALINAGADVNHIDLIGNTPLKWAIQNYAYDLVLLLLENGAKPDPQNVETLRARSRLHFNDSRMKSILDFLNKKKLA